MGTKREKFFSLTLLYLLCVIFISNCQGNLNHKISNLTGTYIFYYPSGEVELIRIYEDSTYHKKIFHNYDDYQHNYKPKFSNVGKWSFSSEDELRFSSWLMYNEMRDPEKLLENPVPTTLRDVYWSEPGFIQKGKISVYFETGYVFEKID